MAFSSSSSHLLPVSTSQSWIHDVFLSFRGEDTRKNFVDHLYAALEQQGIQTYKDDETLARGESIGPSLVKAIQKSRIAIVVFSENYADSSWCLDELVCIIECMNMRGQIVMPVFYNIDPSLVRKQNGKYGKAFEKHKRENDDKVQSWREALVKASNISGWVTKVFANGHESKCIKDIVRAISGRLPLQITKVKKDLIGIETRLLDLKSMLQIGSGGVRVVGIWGVGGGGKTTLASVAYTEISYQFEAHCLLENIRVESRKHDLKRLQETFLSIVLKEKVELGSEIEGRSMIERRLRKRRALVVLDDVDDPKQLKALVGSPNWFGEGSRIIITTRDEHLLNMADMIYEVSLLSRNEAMKLFYRHAYREDKPVEDYEVLSQKVVSYAGGLPLALEILGSFLSDKDKDEWMSVLSKLKRVPYGEVMERLKISYDGLKPDEKDLFLDIACYMRRQTHEQAMSVLDASHFYPRVGVKVLVQKSLIKVSNGIFDMHDLIEEMAHYIVRQEHPNNLEKHCRIWEEKDIVELCAMEDSTLKKIQENEALALPSFLFGSFVIPSYVSDPRLPNVVASMKKLRWIIWEGYHASSFPPNFQPIKLGFLRLIRGQQKQLWEGCKHLPNLKVLEVIGSEYLIRTPDFNGLPCLERLNLEGCVKLKDIHSSIGYHERLVLVNMDGCSGLEEFPPIKRMNKLETLKLSLCRQLRKFPDIQRNMVSLVNLDLGGTSIEIIPPSVGQFCTNLAYFNLHSCYLLRRIKGSLVSLNISQFPHFLRKLDLCGCHLGDGDIPSDMSELLNLKVLDLSRNNFTQLHSSLVGIPCLRFLDLSYCRRLVELPNLPSTIAILIAEGCSSLESVGDLSSQKCLWKVSLWGCNERVQHSMLYHRELHSMLQGNVVEDRFMSVTLPVSIVNVNRVGIMSDNSSNDVRINSYHDTRTITLQLPHNWHCDFSGFLLCNCDYSQEWECTIVIMQERPMYSRLVYDHWEVFEKNLVGSYDYATVGYLPFALLRQTPWWNFASTEVSFQIRGMRASQIGLVPKGDSRKPTIDSSASWDEHDEIPNTFTITSNSKSSSVEIKWHLRYD